MIEVKHEVELMPEHTTGKALMRRNYEIFVFKHSELHVYKKKTAGKYHTSSKYQS